MRTLKKTLCLVLCLAMMAGLCAISASAAFDDADEITYKEAVDVLTGLGVINGVGDNLFAPDGTLTRGSACKIIACLLGDGDIKASSTFEDCKGHWAESYVAYCAANKIVNGYDEKTFGPDDTLTGSAWAKMVLVALGYDADFEGMTGADWEIGVAKALKATDLAAGIKGFDATADISREEACQVAFNALTKDMQLFVPGMKIEGTGLSITAGGSYNTTYAGEHHKLLADVFSASAVEGVITANSANTATVKTTIGGVEYPVNTGLDMLGHFVKVYKDAKTVYAVIDESKVVTVTAPISTKAAFEAAFGTKAITTTGATRFWSSAGVSYIDTAAVAPHFDQAANAAVPGTYILDAANNLKAMIFADAAFSYAQYSLDKVTGFVTTAGSEAITLNGAGSLANNKTSDVVNEYEGIAKDDVVVVTKIGAISNLAKAETVTGKISKVAGTTLTVNGVAYKASAVADNSALVTVSPDFSTEKVLYLVNGEYAALTAVPGEVVADVADPVYAVGGYTKAVPAVTNEYGQVTKVAGTEYYALAVDTTGALVSYKVKSTEFSGGALIDAGAVVTVGNANTDGEYELTVVTATGAASTKAIVSTGTAIAATTVSRAADAGTGKIYFSADQLVIYVEANTTDYTKTTVSTASGKIKIDPTDAIVYATKADTTGTNYTAKVIFVPHAVPTETTAADVMFAVESAASTTMVPYTKADKTTGTAYEHTVYVNGEKKTILVDKGAGSDTALTGFFTGTYNEATGVYTAFTSTSTGVYTAQTVSNLYNGLLTTGSLTDVDASAAVIINTTINAKAKTTLAEIAADASHYTLAIVTKTAAGVESVAYVYITGCTVA